MESSIIDVPRKYNEEDLFGINKYQQALVEFIKLTNTPITIALQGEWGSGKTSLMNQLRWELCDNNGALYFPIWINAWQYSLMKTPSQAIIGILEGCVKQIGALNPNAHKWEESKKKIITGNKKIKTLEQEMDKVFGLYAQVCYCPKGCKPGSGYITQGSDDEYTLAAFNEKCQKDGYNPYSYGK